MKAQSDDDESPVRYAHGMRHIPLMSRVVEMAQANPPNPAVNAPPPLPRLRVTLPLRLLTPIIGGGVRPMEPDRAQPVRVTALRGALRWWWRVLQATPDVKDLRDNERLLFGGVARKGEDEDDNVPSLVRVGVRVTQAPTLVPAGYHKEIGGRLAPLPDWAVGQDLGYALFPLQLSDAARRDWSQLHPGQAAPTQSVITTLEFDLNVELDREALRARVRGHLGANLPADEVTGQAEALAASVVTALRWWLHWGGVGARTRRGFGAVALSAQAVVRGGEALNTPEGPITPGLLAKAPDLPTLKAGQVRPEDRPTLYGAKILRRTSSSGVNNAAAEHRLLVMALRDMRQKPGYARGPGHDRRPGETRWPEAELMKYRLTQGRGLQHPQRVPPHQGNWLTAPRAAFGLPIIMHFKDFGDKQANGQILPADPWPGVHTDRWASPVLLRPQQLEDGKKIVSGVLILAGGAVPKNVELQQGARDARIGGIRGVNSVVGARDTILRDLKEAGGDALLAFATRLRGEHGFVEVTSPSTDR